ncbi:MAG: hypothetical protein KU37_09205 [Sulfuricurvum sp. PC08-66]|nr:MAG: hypothetical protein KU37_09205 [Sulfuricurvum sp. PC08-66]
MRFYSGFALVGDAKLFEAWLDRGEYTIAGFSYGAKAAFEAVIEALNAKVRIDRLQLFSPLFFEQKKERYRILQYEAYTQNSASYIKHFLDNCYAPAINDLRIETGAHTLAMLEELLTYRWSSTQLERVVAAGVHIDVYVGAQDKIVDAKAIESFFCPFATVHTFAHAGHFLISSPKEHHD